MTTEVERRFTPGNVELVRAADERKSIGGYAAKFDRQSRNLGGFVEAIRSTAFNKSRGDGWPDVVARYNHDDNMLLGTTGAGTLRLSVDDIGLFYEVDPPQARADILELVARGDVAKSSFAFRVMPDGDEWGLNDLDIPLRTLTNVQLVDVAPVNTPAYLDTSSGLRSLAERDGGRLRRGPQARAGQRAPQVLQAHRLGRGARVDVWRGGADGPPGPQVRPARITRSTGNRRQGSPIVGIPACNKAAPSATGPLPSCAATKPPSNLERRPHV
jgi:HK97 family phage prohead protease